MTNTKTFKMLIRFALFFFFVFAYFGSVAQIEDTLSAVSPKQVVEEAKKDRNIAKTSIFIDVSTHNFGRVKDGSKVSTSFFIKNTGSNPLIIFEAIASCGCTVPKWPKEPIAPGQMAIIDVVFDTTNKGFPGGLEMEKKITIKANIDNDETYLSLRGFVFK
jgi:hypothetical protein